MFIGLQENPTSRETVSLTKAGEDEGTLPPFHPQKNIYEQQIRDSFWFVYVQD